jgi:hypothetical protein
MTYFAADASQNSRLKWKNGINEKRRQGRIISHFSVVEAKENSRKHEAIWSHLCHLYDWVEPTVASVPTATTNPKSLL